MSLENEPPGELDGESYDLTQTPSDESGPTDAPAKPLNLHWKPSSRKVDETLADGLSNEDLWMLIRRFNKVWPRVMRCACLPLTCDSKSIM